ncbi:hypothetical protein [Rhizobium sp. P44RR-XXIV]|uniref:hypothetical protein n=1 Tax=Rhizobium sp. P44RR-XXIV TaxID=1921145 RepID=UPI00098757AB|nr:hypothetical protein [Rhizobium sp. P44RR-XXIV]TIX89296.1 hypothetical protein BSK43_022125 [Rhizobium sp. P44RR-XXIV]
MKTVLYTYLGQRWLLSELADITGVPRFTLRARLADGWTMEQALGTPTPKQRRAGVVSNLSAFEGTGAGSTSQESANITFSGNEA